MYAFSFLRRSSILFIFSLFSRILGFVRDLAIAWLLGTGPQADLLAQAFRIPHCFRRLLAEGTLSLSLTNAFVGSQEQGKNASWQYTLFRTLTVQTLLASLLVLFFLYILAPYIASLLIPVSADSDVGTLTFLIRLTLPYVLFVCLASLSMAYLHAHGVFSVPAAAPLIFNLVMLLFLGFAFLQTSPSLPLIAVGLSCAGLFQWLWMLRALAATYTPSTKDRFSFSYERHNALRLLVLQVPGLFACSLQHMAFFIAVFFLPCLGEGSVAAFLYAERLLELPLGLIGACFGVASLPHMSRLAGKGTFFRMRRALDESLHWTLLLILPCTAGLYVVAPLLFDSFFQYGEFGREALEITQSTFFLLLPALPALALSRILIGGMVVFLGEVRSAAFTFFNLLLISFLMHALGPLNGLSTGLWLYTIFLFVLLRFIFSIKKVSLAFRLTFWLKALIAACFAGCGAWLTQYFPLGSSGFLLILACLGGIVFWFLAVIILLPRDFMRLRRFLGRPRN
ncbi:MAG: hypothetical protein K5657_09950 [Desulfovibrio sp.]|nr:hypothetical protein [Desulfovibrio sp.]